MFVAVLGRVEPVAARGAVHGGALVDFLPHFDTVPAATRALLSAHRWTPSAVAVLRRLGYLTQALAPRRATTGEGPTTDRSHIAGGEPNDHRRAAGSNARSDAPIDARISWHRDSGGMASAGWRGADEFCGAGRSNWGDGGAEPRGGNRARGPCELDDRSTASACGSAGAHERHPATRPLGAWLCGGLLAGAGPWPGVLDRDIRHRGASPRGGPTDEQLDGAWDRHHQCRVSRCGSDRVKQTLPDQVERPTPY